MKPLLTAADPQAFSIVNPDAVSPYVLTCEHAANAIPSRLGTLGLSKPDLNKHIALDIGALGVAMTIAELTNSALVAQQYSRLVIDCNRQLHSDGLIPEKSDGAAIPRNVALSVEEKLARIDEIHAPFHRTVSMIMHQLQLRAAEPILVSIHSYTPVLNGKERPWEVGLCYDVEDAFAPALLSALESRNETLVIGDNQPYDFDPEDDATLKLHAIDRGCPGVLVEVRQDLIETQDGQVRMGRLIADSLASLQRYNF